MSSNTSAHEPPPFNLTEVDRQVLSQTDDEFVYHDWENLKDIIGKRDRAVFVSWKRLLSRRHLVMPTPHVHSLFCCVSPRNHSSPPLMAFVFLSFRLL